MKKTSKLLLILFLAVGAERTWYRLTDGFSLSAIYTPLPNRPEWDLPGAIPPGALDQPYFYLAKGAQSFVFESADGNYVLKFLKHYRWRMPNWTLRLPLPRPLSALVEHKVLAGRERMEESFFSYRAVAAQFFEESALCCFHFNRTSAFSHELTLYDKLGIRRHIPLGDYQFILQKKVTPASTLFKQLRREGRHEEAKKRCTDLLAFSLQRHARGFTDIDPAIFKNLGFDGDRIALMDIGGLWADAKFSSDAYFYTRELDKIEEKALRWAKVHYPELIPHLQESVQKMRLIKS